MNTSCGPKLTRVYASGERSAAVPGRDTVARLLLQRLFPRPGELEPAEAISRMDFGSRAPSGRPYVVLNMVSSLDGKAAVGGKTSALGGEADRLLFHNLRTQVDAIMAGAGTVRAERYGRAVKSDELRKKREDEGLDPEPLMVIVSGRLDLAPDLPVLADPSARVVIATAAEHELEGVEAQVEYVRTGDDLPVLLATLRESHGVRSVLCEGGPTLNSYLLAAGLVDELFLTTSAQLFGGVAALTIVAGKELHEPVKGELISLYEGDGDLFARWKISTKH
jgi:riboflavin-specific deaminase-like protein